jgi:hypothetical protein
MCILMLVLLRCSEFELQSHTHTNVVSRTDLVTVASGSQSGA